ncbi:HTH-type transcriptional regulator [Perilla frutescens var. hirtella]|uniref:HTH-type transcriptional regulator n=1 Tax=Perilla frutescens var. hirtella TaxID=608512 RepID=A0AAD4JEA3_PERFH|nr:HTH-type transcriptional regulator [Perilla frutescens var. frutescens]KAH6791846.1 HTH-type transcriptional regulator [Perilla frutescens var. hirtella]KAH6832147.1 HTH-type transcriptional regulator [Perilla frutescens var. hirtella]
MGICSSCDSTSVATAKLILDDGRLQEYPYPVKVSYVLQRNPAFFICNSDEMDFDDVISAVSDDEELQPGQLYFALPLSQLKHRLQAEEMAALAVKASSALTKSGCGDKCGCRRNILVFPGENDLRQSAKVGETRSGRRRGGAAGRRGKVAARLSAIPE